MANKTIPDLPAASVIAAADLFEISAAGVSQKATAEQMGLVAIAVNVYMSGSQSISGTDEVLNFDAELLDTHNCFDTTTHLFTAPMAGKYSVSLSVRLTTGSYMSVAIVPGGAPLATTGTATTATDAFITVTAIVDLALGATLYGGATFIAYSAGIDQGVMTIEFIGV